MNKPKHWLVVPAAGIGTRMKSELPKQYLTLGHRYLLDITLSRILDQLDFAGCMVPLNARDRWWQDTEASGDDRIQTCTGGEERVHSVLSALHALQEQAQPDDWVLVHDAARPCLHSGDLSRLLTALSDHPVGGLLAAPVTDTLKQADSGEPARVDTTIDRRHLWRALTPQMFRFGALTRALEQCLSRGYTVTDESSALEMMGDRPVLIEGRPDNIKITVPSDLELASFILERLQTDSV